MMNGYGYGPGLGFPMGGSGIALLALWSLFWQGLALWHAAKRGERWWFLALLLIHTAGILDIVYLFGVAKLKKEELIPMEDKPKTPPSAPSAPTPEAHH